MKKSVLDENKFDEVFGNKLEKYRKNQIYFEIFKNQIIDFENMTNLPKDLRKKLDGNFDIIDLKVDKILDKSDTTKFSFETKDGNFIETVLMYHWSKKQKGKLNRITICLSSQVGCAMGCKFCVTGKLGFKRNLSYEEIISQLLFANSFVKKKFGKKEDGTLWRVRNVVFMGMGEPLLNYENIKRVIYSLLEQKKFSLSKRHITISTCGIIPGIERLIKDNINVMLAISLHSPNQINRQEIMPFAKNMLLDDLMKVIDKYIKKTNNRIFYEYIMIKGVTDQDKSAYELIKLLKGKLAHINLIPYNFHPSIDYKESSMEQIKKFKRILETGGLTVTIRDSLGRELNSACGQLGYEKVGGITK